MAASARLTPYLAEFRDPQREAAFQAEQAGATPSWTRAGMAVVAVAVLVSLWLDLQLFAATAPKGIPVIVLARATELAGALVVGLGPGRHRSGKVNGWTFVAGAGLASLGHHLATYVLFVSAGRPANVYWSALFTLLSLTAFVQPLRYALPAALTFLLGAGFVHTLVAPLFSREVLHAMIALFLTAGLGTVLAYRLNRGRRHEFAALELERQTNLLLSDEVHEGARRQDDLVAHTTKLETRLLAAQRLEAIGRLAGGVAHDLNNLLTPILAYTEMVLSEPDLRPDLRGMLTEVARSGESARSLVAQLLAFGRRQYLVPKRILLTELVREQEATLRSFLREDMRLRVNCEEEGIVIQADRTQLVQVLLNLVVNARDALPKGGDIELRVHRANPGEVPDDPDLDGKRHHAILTMTDNGIGMDEATRPRIFEPFFTTKSLGKGTGLGLATVYGIVKQHGGAIQVEGALGQGTTFRVWLPTIETDEAPADSLRRPPLSLRGGEETILIVDEDMVMRQLLGRMLSRNGYRVLEAEHGEEALALCRAQLGPVHLLVTDRVPGSLRGPELWRALARERSELRVLFVASGADESGQAGIEGEVLAKPFTLAELMGQVRRTLDSPRLLGKTSARRA